MRFAAAVAILLSSCAKPTGNVVAFVDASSFQWCNIHAGWWTAELLDTCGAPVWAGPKVGTASYCVAYRSQRFGEPPLLVVCLDESVMQKHSFVPPSPKMVPAGAPEKIAHYKVAGVYWLDDTVPRPDKTVEMVAPKK